MKKILLNIVLVLSLGGLITLSGLRLATLLDDTPSAAARVHDQQEAIRPATLKVTAVTDRTCQNCTSPEIFLDALKKQKAFMNSMGQVDAATDAGKKFIAAHNITRFPAVVVEGETSHGQELASFLRNTSTPLGSGFVYYVQPPYRDVASNKVRGNFQLTYLMSADCKGCYDVTNNSIALRPLGVDVKGNNKIVSTESPEGKKLVEQYKIRYLPTILLTGDLDVYQGFQGVWPRVGTKEADGTYVLRDGVKLMGTYYDLELKKVVAPTAQKSSPSSP